MEFNILVVWVVFTLYGRVFSAFTKTCDQQSRENCCYGHKWNKTTHRCEECSLGFTGPGCTLQCKYPAYGEGCSRVCKCPMKLCDFALGCDVSIQTGNEITYNHRSKAMSEATETTKTAVTLAGRGTTEKIPAESTGTSPPVSLVSYLTVVLTCVFTAFFLVYIATYFPKFKSFIKGSDTTGVTLNEIDVSTYASI